MFYSDQKKAFVIFNNKGDESDYNKMLETALNSNVVLFGEFHDNPIIHWLQLELTIDIYKVKKDQLIFGAKMFEADNQIIINKYFFNFDILSLIIF